jgi:5-methylcytosine-specific restriction endonuclease McrA
VAHCLDCGRPGPGTRCPEHEARRRRIRNADRHIAKAVVAAAPWCHCTRPDCHEAPGECGRTEDLTADHVIPLAAGGTHDGARQVLCRSCNTKKGTR